jgi:hypothetical protein
MAVAVFLGLLTGCAGERIQQPGTTPELRPPTAPVAAIPATADTPESTLAALRTAVQRDDLDMAFTYFTPAFRPELAAWVRHAGAPAVLQSLRTGLGALPPESPYRVVRSDASGVRWETLCPGWQDAQATFASARHVPGVARVHLEYAGLPFEHIGGAWLVSHW